MVTESRILEEPRNQVPRKIFFKVMCQKHPQGGPSFLGGGGATATLQTTF